MKINDLMEFTPSFAKLLNNMADTNDISLSKIGQILHDKGFECNKDGEFAHVCWQGDRNIVVKIAIKEDQPWIRFAKLVNNNKSPVYPKIRNFREYFEPKYKETLFFCFMERLDHIESAPQEELAELAAYMILKGKNYYQPHCHQFWEEQLVNSMNDDDDPKQLALNFTQKHPLFVNALNMLLKNKGSFNMDIHDHNVMYRHNNNEFVIIDPYVD